MITLKTLSDATEQQVFDQVAKHLLMQSRKSVQDGAYKYHSSDGTKCAAGCLVSDDEYDPEMEGMTWKGNKNVNSREDVPEKHLLFVHGLQRIHDHKFVSDWKNALIDFAKDHMLNYVIATKFRWNDNKALYEFNDSISEGLFETEK